MKCRICGEEVPSFEIVDYAHSHCLKIEQANEHLERTDILNEETSGLTLSDDTEGNLPDAEPSKSHGFWTNVSKYGSWVILTIGVIAFIPMADEATSYSPDYGMGFVWSTFLGLLFSALFFGLVAEISQKLTYLQGK